MVLFKMIGYLCFLNKSTQRLVIKRRESIYQVVQAEWIAECLNIVYSSVWESLCSTTHCTAV